MAFTQQTTASVPNVDLITQTLAKLQPDSELQKYAAMHKNDPYILSLATAESNRRKALRLGAQGNVGQMPKVADAAIAGMAPAPGVAQLPEEQGIGALPAPNMQRMADGGIAGYDDQEGMAQGGMFDFAQTSEPVVRMADGGHVPRYQGNTVDGSVVRSNPLFNVPGMVSVQPRASFTQAGAPENQTVWEQLSGSLQKEGVQRQLQIIEDRIARGIAGPEEKAYYAQLKAKVEGTPQLAAPKDSVNPDEVLMAAEKAAKNKPAATNAAAPSAEPKPTVNKPAVNMGGGQGIKALYEQFAGPQNVRDTELNSIEQRVREQGEAETSAAQRQLNQLKADIAAQGEYGKDRETKLKAKEERIAKEEGRAGGLALLEAGLAMMSGTSQNAFANIGQGAMVGTAAYRKSMDKLEDARDKLEDAYGRLEDVRFNQKNLNNAEIRKATADVDKAANAGLKSLTDFAVTRYGMKREDAKAMFTGAIQERVANINAGATLESARMRSKDQSDYLQAIRGSGAIEQARKNVMEGVMKANKYGSPEEIQAQFEKEWEKTLQLNPALAKLAGAAGGGSAPASGADFVLNPQTGKLEPRK
jgi:hypothetical protein